KPGPIGASQTRTRDAVQNVASSAYGMRRRSRRGASVAVASLSFVPPVSAGSGMLAGGASSSGSGRVTIGSLASSRITGSGANGWTEGGDVGARTAASSGHFAGAAAAMQQVGVALTYFQYAVRAVPAPSAATRAPDQNHFVMRSTSVAKALAEWQRG